LETLKILLYSPVFAPSVGGVETITDTLARNLIKAGHQVTVVTETPLRGARQNDCYPFAVVRHPPGSKRLALARSHDIVHSNSASLAMVRFASEAGKPFIWTHNGYQVSCVDGLGWVDGKAAPMTPWASLHYHRRLRGSRFFVKECAKLYYRRFVAKHRVAMNCAATAWVAKRQPLPRQRVLYTPYPLSRFKQARREVDKLYDFIYVGRLVSEKGVMQLMDAFNRLLSETLHSDAKLLIVGEGDRREQLVQQVADWGIAASVTFTGSLRGDDLVAAIEQADVAVVPSAWEEPMGGVSLELLAAGKCLIVSANGGHAEIVGDAGLVFPNGNVDKLLACMRRLLDDPGLRERLKACAEKRLALFDEVRLTQKYIDVYRAVIRRHRS